MGARKIRARVASGEEDVVLWDPGSEPPSQEMLTGLTEPRARRAQRRVPLVGDAG